MCSCTLTTGSVDTFHGKCFNSNILPKQVITWEEKPTGLEACIFTRLSLSGQAGEGLETFSEHISSLMLETFAILTMVRLRRIVYNKTCFPRV